MSIINSIKNQVKHIIWRKYYKMCPGFSRGGVE